MHQTRQACHWKSQNTFTTFYLKDLAGQNQVEGDFHLGACTAAQRVMASTQQLYRRERGAPDLSDGACHAMTASGGPSPL